MTEEEKNEVHNFTEPDLDEMYAPDNMRPSSSRPPSFEMLM